MRNGSFSREYVYSFSPLSSPLRLKFVRRSPRSLKILSYHRSPSRTLDRPFYIHVRNHPLPFSLHTRSQYLLYSLLKKKKKKKTNRTWLHFAFVDSSDRNISTEIIYMRVFVRISCFFRKKKEEGKKSVRS